MKKNWSILIISLICIIASTILIIFFWNNKSEKKEKNIVRIGVSLYRFDDTFISTLRKEIEDYVKEYEINTGIKINMEIVDAQNSQIIQNKQIDRFIALKYDVLCINPVDRADTSNNIDKAVAAGIPVVFFNRQPVEDDMNRADNLYYIGVDPKLSAIAQGKILVDEYEKNHANLDLNMDGIINYVLLEGEPSHQDSLIRTEWSIKVLQEAKLPIKKLNGGIANWDRNQASVLMEQWLKEYGDEIELVISNNDDMALGAIDAMEAKRHKKAVKVVGIDGTPAALEALSEGKLLGTVSSQKNEYAKVILDIAINCAQSRELPSYIKDKLINNKYYDIEQIPITQKN